MSYTLFDRCQHHLRRLSFAALSPRRYAKLQGAWHSRRGERTHAAFLRRGCLYVHIPKCAGNSIEQALFGGTLGGHYSIWWYQMNMPPREFASLFKFTIVRNPWDRLYSAYRFLKAGGMNDYDRAWTARNLAPYADFESFVDRWVNERNVRSFVQFQPQWTFVYMGRRLLVDYVGRFERIDEDFKQVCSRVGVEAELPRVNVGNRHADDFRAAYTPRMREIVARVYAEDIRRFGYGFDAVAAD